MLLIGLGIIFYYYVEKYKLRNKRANELLDDGYNYEQGKGNVINDENANKLLEN